MLCVRTEEVLTRLSEGCTEWLDFAVCISANDTLLVYRLSC